jgi:beta-glucosidase
MNIANFDEARAAVRSGTSPTEAARHLVAAMTPAERLWCLDGDMPVAGLAFVTLEDGYHRAPFYGGVIERLGVPGIAFADGPRGSVLFNSTCFPVAMARGATWDPALEERVGEAIGAELRASGANLTGAVCVNVLRHPAWGRAQETYGEDPYHVGELGAAFTRGLQRHVMACAKHFACNSMENSRFKVDVEVDEVALHEVYLPHFKRIVDEGVASIMSAYNKMNGDWCGESGALLTDVLRGEWGFEGFVISDFAFGLRDAARSLAGGLDIEMPARMVRAHHLPAALERGDASWDDVDRAVTRLLSTLLRFDEILSVPPPPQSTVGSVEHRALARDVARRSIVLLRNEMIDGRPVLPFDANARVALVGPLADTVNVGDGGSSDVWDLDCRTIADGLRAAVNDLVVEPGDIEAAVAAARGADVAIVVVGYTRYDEGEFLGGMDSLPTELFPAGDDVDEVERFMTWKATVPTVVRPPRQIGHAGSFALAGDRLSLRLLDADVALVRAVAAVNPRTIVVIQSGSAVVCSEWLESVPAVVQAWYGGCEAGTALADILTGVCAPSGRLPFTIPRDERDLPPFEPDRSSFTYDRWHGWWHLARNECTAAFPFGFGLGYTDFALSDVGVAHERERVIVSGTLANTVTETVRTSFRSTCSGQIPTRRLASPGSSGSRSPPTRRWPSASRSHPRDSRPETRPRTSGAPRRAAIGSPWLALPATPRPSRWNSSWGSPRGEPRSLLNPSWGTSGRRHEP